MLSNAAIKAKVSGSVALTSNSSSFIKRVRANDAANPMAMPAAVVAPYS